MEAALAEMTVDDLMQDVEEDVDFVSKGTFNLSATVLSAYITH